MTQQEGVREGSYGTGQVRAVVPYIMQGYWEGVLIYKGGSACLNRQAGREGLFSVMFD